MAGDAPGVKTILQFMADGAAGGGTTLVLSLVESLIAEGWRVVVLTETDSYGEKRAKELGAEVITAPFMGSRTDPALPAAVQSAVEKTKPDVVHLHGTRAIYFGRSLTHPAVIATIHGYHHLRQPWHRRMMGAWGLKKSFGAIRDIIFVANYDRRIGESNGLIPPKAKVHVIHNGIAIPSIPVVEKEPKLISFPHRMSPQKDPNAAVMAFQNLTGYRLEIAGTGEWASHVEQLAKMLRLEGITFRRGLDREQTLELIARSGTVLMTSRWEGLPIVLLEAMAIGTPVVAPAICGIPEIIEDGIDGILVKEHTPEAYAQGIRRLEDESLRNKIIENAKAKIQRSFTWNVCFAKHLALYEERAAN